jgi:Domain of unknown function (DUF6894)
MLTLTLGASFMRLFFDVQHQDSRSYDYHGGEFGRPEDAAQMAELIAADLGCSATDDCTGSQVEVRNAAGETLFSVPVLVAA